MGPALRSRSCRNLFHRASPSCTGPAKSNKSRFLGTSEAVLPLPLSGSRSQVKRKPPFGAPENFASGSTTVANLTWERHAPPAFTTVVTSKTVARGGALDNPAPRSARGIRSRTKSVAAEAATTKCSRRARPCGGRLRGRRFVRALTNPAPSAGAGLSSAPPRAGRISEDRFIPARSDPPAASSNPIDTPPPPPPASHPKPTNSRRSRRCGTPRTPTVRRDDAPARRRRSSKL